MSRRSSRAAVVGLVALAAAWALGSTPLVVAGAGFVLAAGLSRAWARIARGSVEVERRLAAGVRTEGDDIVVVVRWVRRRRLPRGAVVARQRLGATVREAHLAGPTTAITFFGVARGRHVLEPLEVTITDPLGLERVTLEFGRAVDVLVRPRIPRLTAATASHGAHDAGDSRSAVRRPTGFEIHAVRDYAPGEPLRSVHWPSTARRGRLMVKELDDSPRDDLVVILDQDPEGVTGESGRSSFDAAVRAAGAIARAEVQLHRRVSIAGSAPATALEIRSLGHDWEVALDALAVVQPVVGARIDAALRHPVTAVARARELIVVTGRPDRAVEALLEMRRTGRVTSLVAIASETFAGRPRSTVPALLRAAFHGVPVSVIEAGVPIEDALAAQRRGATGG